MTLISNIIYQDYIIIASDKKELLKKITIHLKLMMMLLKLLLGNNYAIGVQGSLQTMKTIIL